MPPRCLPRSYFSAVHGSRERTGLKMKMTRRITSVSDKTMTRLLRLGFLVLGVGVLLFAGLYYQDQHVNAGPSMVDRQIAGAEAAVKTAPNNVETRLQLAAAYLQDKRSNDALAQYDEILKADNGNRSALLGRGGILIAKGDLTAAAASYHKITDVAAKGEFAGADPMAQEARYDLGSIAVKQGKAKEAITQLSAALKIDATDSDSLYLMGVAQLKAGAPKVAINALKKAILFVPTGWCEPYSQLALAYGKLGLAPQATYASGMADTCKQPAEAKRLLKTLIKGPIAVDSLLGLALISETESNNPEAISFYKQVLTHDRKNATAVSALLRLGAGPTSGPTPTPLGAK
jgi:tetratricopeptide (TPR) repeat protein